MSLLVVSALLLLASVQSGLSSREYFLQCDDTCDVDPCRGRECPANTGAKCVSRCCRAYFYDKYGNDITARCKCSRGVRPRKCKQDPCDTAKCNKGGECRTDRCGGCNPVFYNRKVKAIKGCPVVAEYDSRCPAVKSRRSGSCPPTCLSNSDCESEDKRLICCSNECGSQCRYPPLDDRCPPPDPDIMNSRMDFCGLGGCRSNVDCKGKEMCCFNGCHKRCISPPFLDPRCKNPTIDDFRSPRNYRCISNKDCGPNRMCCGHGQNTRCSDAPAVPYHDQRCPVPRIPTTKIRCDKLCSNHSDCRSDYMCCPHYCGTHCVPKPKPCDIGESKVKCGHLCKGRSCPKHFNSRCRVHACNGCKVEFYDWTNLLLSDCVEKKD